MLKKIFDIQLVRLVLLFLTTLSMVFSSSHSGFSCEISIFDCAQGNAVVCKYNDKSMVFDIGRKAASKFVQYEDKKSGSSTINTVFEILDEDSEILKLEVKPWFPLRKTNDGLMGEYKQGFENNIKDYIGDNLQIVFTSHPDADHYNLIAPLELAPQAFVLGGYYGAYSKVFQAYLKSLELNKEMIVQQSKNNGYKERAQRDHEKSVDFYQKRFNFVWKKINTSNEEYPKITILSANANGNATKLKNEDSMIIKVQGKRSSILLPGDAEEVSWNLINEGDLQSDFLLLSHHGSNTNSSTTIKLLNKIKPKACFISAGFSHSHPSGIIINCLLKYFNSTSHRTRSHFITFFEGKNNITTQVTDAPIFTTIDNGTLKFDLNNKRLNINTSRNFIPIVPWTLSNSKYVTYFSEADDQRVVNYEELKELDKKKKPEEYLDKVYKITENKEKKYFFKYGKAYFEVKQETTLISEYARNYDEDEGENEISSEDVSDDNGDLSEG